MTIGSFAEAIARLLAKHGGSVTSWGRSDARSRQVGGFGGDPHTWWLGCDAVYDAGPPDLGALKHEAAAMGLKVIRETGKPHDHFQPDDVKPGPQTAYNGKSRD